MNQRAQANLWYVVESAPSAERKARDELVRAGYDVFWPFWRKEIKHHRTKKWVMKDFALFVRYGFVRLASPDRCSELGDIDGVNKVLRVQGFPVPVNDDVVVRIRRAVDSGAFDETREHGYRLRAGDKVRIAEGQFLGLEGLIDAVKDNRKAKVLVSIFGRSVPTSVDLENLAKVA
ncbi:MULTISPECIES: transcription termination/antitermination NusG family protein [unclassified Mesorhizobium]|uniref:transcription termination/antitermination protein NusG n=1 Tax=unclassified Mesorhizobium TaxID=325217 RepID=UPI0003CFAE3E|nr:MULTISPECIES: transcription termination/antitermination NusG family protein [unclassified Mesorhizobium]ESZ07166.1 hypothetical protein X736_10960 [Mesorhizobium sp. L2C089B000]WJI52559.1 hypothetical protein NLY44_07785 [Mesorhizobium sp. C089B]